MIINKKLDLYLSHMLDTHKIKDYVYNGLQIAGKKNIKTIVTGVSISLELIMQSLIFKTDAIIVHHGLFWNNENPVITGPKLKKIKTIINNKINLFAYHLPLDNHPILGNNIQLANLLNLKVTDTLCVNNNCKIVICNNITNINIKNLIDLISKKLNRIPIVVGALKTCKKIAICTGAAQNLLEIVYNKGVDVYISGEISERNTIQAREMGITYISAGHHATEKFGVQALGKFLAHNFKLRHIFLDIKNPV